MGNSKSVSITYSVWSPAPGTYKQDSDFCNSHPHMSSFSFGISREAYSKVYIKENPPTDKNVPGPGSYQVQPKFSNEAQKYSLRGRNANHRKEFRMYNAFSDDD